VDAPRLPILQHALHGGMAGAGPRIGARPAPQPAARAPGCGTARPGPAAGLAAQGRRRARAPRAAGDGEGADGRPSSPPPTPLELPAAAAELSRRLSERVSGGVAGLSARLEGLASLRLRGAAGSPGPGGDGGGGGGIGGALDPDEVAALEAQAARDAFAGGALGIGFSAGAAPPRACARGMGER
jgi:hypothetical protein